ncbi:MAG TPA: CotH kinase family protein [Vicinamibacterales bacterium]|nr:CotH kinase family protein [Vicinamibacterales bacterium]
MTVLRLTTAVVLALAASMPARAQTTDDFFNPDVLQRVELWMNEADWAKLKANFQENTYYPADFLWNGQTVRNVGIRSRGLGSRSATKPGLRVDIDRYSTQQEFLGLKSFVLDNLTQDHSGIKETATMRFFTRLGIPAPRETHTRLYVNGRYAGLYGLVESVDKTMMGRVFGSIGDDIQNDGYLFEYNYILDRPWRFEYLGSGLTPYQEYFDIKTNESHTDEQIWRPIEELVRLVNQSSSGDFEPNVAPRLDLPAFVRYIAAQNFVANHDGFNGYAGMNNFYFYRLEDSTQHVFVAWDEDNAFLTHEYPIDTRLNDNVLSRRTLEIAAYSQQYLSVLNEAASSAEGWLRQEMQRQFEMISTAMQEDTQKPYSNAEYAAERDRLLAFPEARITYVRCEVARESGAALPSNCD